MDNFAQSTADRLLKKKEVAALLACSLRTVDRLVNLGRLTKIKCGGTKFRQSEVSELVNGSGI